MPPRKDQAIYDYVLSKTTDVQRLLPYVARAVGLDPLDALVVIHQSKRLTTRNLGARLFTVVEPI